MDNNNNTTKSEVENALGDSAHAITNDGVSLPVMDVDHGQTHFVAPGPMQGTNHYKRPDFHDVPTDNNIKDYLARPYLYTSGVFTSGSTAPVQESHFTPQSFVSTNNLSGAYGYRATVCFRLEVSAAPQAQGIVRMAYEYLPPSGTRSKITYRPVLAQLPGAELNLRSGSAMEVRIPFVSDRDFWPLINGTYTVQAPAFAISVTPYAPVSWDTTTTSTPTWALYFWFEDVELVGKSVGCVTVVPQGNTENAGKGVVTNWFSAASKVATYAASIPLLSSYITPLSWMLNAAHKVSAHYGWSKPTNGSYVGTMQMATVRGINTCADSDFANPMGYYANNEVAVQDGFAGSKVDEMSLCYLTCKPGLIASCNLLPSDTRGQVKWICPVSPSHFVFQSSSTGFSQVSSLFIGANTASGNKVGYCPSPINFCASFFERWRGNIIFRFKFNTTKFHAGKLLIGYVPGEDLNDGVSLGTFSQAPQPTSRYDFQSTLVDLRNTSEIDFLVPFTYPAAWCDTGMDYLQPETGVVNYYGLPNTGAVFVRVIDPLYGPDNVMQSCQMLVEVLSDCGLEFAHPITSLTVPLDPTSTPVLIAQSALSDLAATDATKYAAGERIASVKQLAMRPIWQYQSSALASRNWAYFASISYTAYSAFTTSTPFNYPSDFNTIVSKLGSLYALARGGLVVRVIPTGQTRSTYVSTSTWATYNSTDARSSGLSVEYNVGNFLKLPYYAKNTRMRTGASSRSITTGGVDLNNYTRTLNFNWSTTDSVNIYGLAAGDDFQFGCFTGIGPCVTLGAKGLNASAPGLTRPNP